MTHFESIMARLDRKLDNKQVETDLLKVNPQLAEKEAIEWLRELGYKVEKSEATDVD